MLYKRSSFLKFLQAKYQVETKPLRDGVLQLRHGPQIHYMIMTSQDRIDYEEIYIIYNKLLLPDIPTYNDIKQYD